MDIDEPTVLIDVEVLGEVVCILLRVRLGLDELSVLERLGSGTRVVSAFASRVKLCCIAFTSIVCMRFAVVACDTG